MLSGNAILATADPVGTTALMTIGSAGEQANDNTVYSAVSGNGRFVVFASSASNLVSGDTNEAADVFVRDRATGTTSRVSVSSAEEQSNGANSEYDPPAISADGRYVAFVSDASNLVPGDTNGHADVFVRDRTRGTTARVSVTEDGRQANGDSHAPAISMHGGYVAFYSLASNLVRGDSNGSSDVFLRNRTRGTTRRVSVSGNGAQGNGASFDAAISEHGGTVAFNSSSSNLVRGDHNQRSDVFAWDRATGATRRVSLSSTGVAANLDSDHPSVSAHGRYIAFETDASNLVAGDTNGHHDVFVRDRHYGTTERVSVSSDESQGETWSLSPAMSGNGRYVAFESPALNLVPDTFDGDRVRVFVRDRWAGSTSLVSVNSDGVQANSDAGFPVISTDGHHITFDSGATNLVPSDTNDKEDVFIRHTSE
jgi:Tol biopolymer transport system component